MSSDLSLREMIKKEFGTELPISGGDGNSIESAIVIDQAHEDWSDVEYACLKYINQLLGRSWKLIKTTIIEKDGRKFDQMKLEVNGDDSNYYNYYFDITYHV